MDQVIIVRLARGEVAFYDPATKIHLTIGSPTATVGKGQNLAGIRRSVRSRRLTLVAGSLDPVAPVVETTPVAEVQKTEPPATANMLQAETPAETIVPVAAQETAEKTDPVEETPVLVEADETPVVELEEGVADETIVKEETDEIATDAAKETAALSRKKNKSK